MSSSTAAAVPDDDSPAQESSTVSGRKLSLTQAWSWALTHNATYQAAVSHHAATQTLKTQGLSLLLPHIQAGYSYAQITGHQQFPGLSGGTRRSPLDYDSTTAYIQLRQPILDFGRYYSYRWYVERAERGDVLLRVARSELALKFAKTWIDVLRARTKLQLRQALAESLAQRAEAQKALYAHGAGSVTSVRQTQARLDKARADVISAQAQLRVARQALQAFIGCRCKPSAMVFTSLPALVPAQLNDWLKRARSHNPKILASRAKVDVAKVDVTRSASQYAPNLSLVASWSRADSENLSTLSQRSNTFAIGLQLTVPIFSGGSTSARLAQSQAQAQTVKHRLDVTRQRVLTEVMRYYQQVVDGAERIQALKSAVKASKLELKGTRLGYQYGVNSNLDVLQAQENLFQAHLRLAQSKLTYIQARIALKITAGANPGSVFESIGETFFALQNRAAPPALKTQPSFGELIEEPDSKSTEPVSAQAPNPKGKKTHV